MHCNLWPTIITTDKRLFTLYYIHAVLLYIRIILYLDCPPIYSWPTYQVLDHEGSFGPHLSHKVVDVKIIFLLQSLHHRINSNECASSAHTSTVRREKAYSVYAILWTNCAHYINHFTLSYTFFNLQGHVQQLSQLTSHIYICTLSCPQPVV